MEDKRPLKLGGKNVTAPLISEEIGGTSERGGLTCLSTALPPCWLAPQE
jgi:hypothetical protein